MQTCDPLKARQWFKVRTPINLGVVLVGFVVLVFALQNFIHPLIADVIALGIAFFVYFYVLDKQAIGIVCPNQECNNYIETNAPWKCGNPNCLKSNEQVDDFPIVYRCQHCGVEPKAFECPHCRQAIFLGKDRLKTIYATFIKMPEKIKIKPAKKDPIAEKVVQQHEAIRETEHRLRKAKLDLELKAVEKELNPQKEKTEEEKLEESIKIFRDRNMSGAKIVARMKAENLARFEKDSVELQKANALIDQWALNHLDEF